MPSVWVILGVWWEGVSGSVCDIDLSLSSCEVG